jgi:hypothetical protein
MNLISLFSQLFAYGSWNFDYWTWLTLEHHGAVWGASYVDLMVDYEDGFRNWTSPKPGIKGRF